MSEEKSIKILKGGAYMVSGSIPISEKIVTPEGKGYIWKDGNELEQKEKYALCRCGRTKKAPFCDGAHSKGIPFGGKEKADMRPYELRSKTIEGKKLDLKDDGRCAFARFCHTDRGDVWTLVKNSEDPDDLKIAITAANECPAGRFEVYDKEGNLYEEKTEPAIIVVQDPEKGCSGGYYVTGGIKLISSNGDTYETRDRYVLCRCGISQDMPFCDAGHISRRYKDNKR